MFTISKVFEWEGAHRLLGHPKCGRLHGHSYTAEFFFEAEELPKDGMVRDYGGLTDIKEFIDNVLDHRYVVTQELLRSNDPYYIASRNSGLNDLAIINIERSTAEYLSEWLFKEFSSKYPELVRVTVKETKKTSATYEFRRGIR